MKENFLVIDIGTQSLRASIVDKKGDILLFSQQKYEVAYNSPEEGFAEQDVDYYIQKLCDATNDLKNKDEELFSTILGMDVVDFRDSSIILDKDKKPIRPAILWLDQRVTLLHGKNLKAYEKVLFGLIGMSDTVKYNAERTVTWWLRQNEPENWRKMKYFCTLGAYFNYRITNNLVVSSADCIGHYPIDFKKGKWFPAWHPKHDIFGIPKDALPELVPVGSKIGEVSEEFSKLSSIPAGTPLFASGSDKACETFGNGCIEPNQASISLGTACSIDVVSNKYSEPEKFLPSYQAPYKGYYDLEIQIYRGLWMIPWFIEEFGSEDVKLAEKEGISVEEHLNKMIEKIPAGSDGLVLQPYWGPGLKRPNAKGSIIGFSAVHTRYHLYRAIIEGIIFGLREGLDEIMRKTHRKPDYLVVSGGGSDSKIFLQIIADIFGIEVHKSYNTESSTLGGAMSGFIHAGVYKDANEALVNMVKQGPVIKPDLKNHAIYDKLYKKVYLKMYPSLKKCYNNCKNFYLENKGEN